MSDVDAIDPKQSETILSAVLLEGRAQGPRSQSCKTHLSELIGKAQLGLSIEPERYGAIAKNRFSSQ